jgi:putative Holliday junction resolvase
VRYLALDLGARRIGLSVSDPDGKIAFPAGFIECRGGERDLEALRSLAAERGIESIVIGLPLHLNGRRGPEAQAAERFAKRLEAATGLPVDLFDERWTTREAERELREQAGGRRRRRERGIVDATAATILLRTYLERARTTGRGGAGS